MPYELKRSGDGFVVVSSDTGKVHSNKPLNRQRALAQERALYANVPDARTGVSSLNGPKKFLRGGRLLTKNASPENPPAGRDTSSFPSNGTNDDIRKTAARKSKNGAVRGPELARQQAPTQQFLTGGKLVTVGPAAAGSGDSKGAKKSSGGYSVSRVGTSAKAPNPTGSANSKGVKYFMKGGKLTIGDGPGTNGMFNGEHDFKPIKREKRPPGLKRGGKMKLKEGSPAEERGESKAFEAKEVAAGTEKPTKKIPGYKKGGKNFIQSAIKKPGALHEELGVPKGETIPKSKINAAAKKGGKLGQRARFAKVLAGVRS